MSYGQNLPWGLQATRTLGAASWNGQTNPYFIKSGYSNNIFKGDPVVVAGTTDAGGTNTGYLISLYDVNTNVFNAQATLGIFQGCSFITPTATNPIDPASPGRQYWPANTATLNAVPAVAYVVDDPNTVFNVQTATNVGAMQSDVGNTFNYSFVLTGTTVQGNTNTGQSSVSAIAGTPPARGLGSAVRNMICVAIVPSPPNPSTAGTQYNNIEVLIQNHQYAQRAPARL
jgi:hypothetical protein